MQGRQRAVITTGLHAQWLQLCLSLSPCLNGYLPRGTYHAERAKMVFKEKSTSNQEDMNYHYLIINKETSDYN